MLLICRMTILHVCTTRIYPCAVMLYGVVLTPLRPPNKKRKGAATRYDSDYEYNDEEDVHEEVETKPVETTTTTTTTTNKKKMKKKSEGGNTEETTTSSAAPEKEKSM